MFVKHNANEKAVFAKLAADGNDLYCDSRGWWFNEKCFESFVDYFIFCESQISAH